MKKCVNCKQQIEYDDWSDTYFHSKPRWGDSNSNNGVFCYENDKTLKADPDSIHYVETYINGKLVKKEKIAELKNGKWIYY
jgi:hypothetical protein